MHVCARTKDGAAKLAVDRCILTRTMGSLRIRPPSPLTLAAPARWTLRRSTTAVSADAARPAHLAWSTPTTMLSDIHPRMHDRTAQVPTVLPIREAKV